MPIARQSRLDHLVRFYDALHRLAYETGGPRVLRESTGRLDWPNRGVYFFFENGENRTGSGSGDRVVRVGTHALTSSSRTTLWNRLSNHRGTASGSGNHRGSIFRSLVGNALMRRDPSCAIDTWGVGNSADRETRQAEGPLELLVSDHICQMPFLWLRIDDPPSLRGRIERNSIGLLSNFERESCDPPSPSWLGRDCNRPRVRQSGLWNQNHVEESYEPAFLDVLDQLVDDPI